MIIPASCGGAVALLLHARPRLWLLWVTRATPRLRVRAQVAARMLVARAVASRQGGCVGRGRPSSVALVVSEMHFANLPKQAAGQSQFDRVRIVARVRHWVEIWWQSLCSSTPGAFPCPIHLLVVLLARSRLLRRWSFPVSHFALGLGALCCGIRIAL